MFNPFVVRLLLFAFLGCISLWRLCSWKRFKYTCRFCFHPSFTFRFVEWSYSGNPHDNGLWFQKPIRPNRTSPFKEQFYVGTTHLTPEQVVAVINSMRVDYPCKGYNILFHNCHDFSADFISRICDPVWLSTSVLISTYSYNHFLPGLY